MISSRTDQPGIHLPILDLDVEHRYERSTTEGHAHLYLDRPIPTWRWVILMWGLRVGKVSDKGFFAWSLRRRGNFVRLPSVRKLTNTKRRKAPHSRLQE